jgi:hypothetical protein
LHIAVEPDIRDAYAGEAAHDWSNRIIMGDPTEYDTTGPASTYAKGRVLTESAEKNLGKWMITDPRQAIPEYFTHSAKRIAYAERYGLEADSGGLEAILQRAVDGGARGEDIRAMRELVQTITGRQKAEVQSNIARTYSMVQSVGSMALMTKSAMTSLGEPMAMRARTGRVRDALEAYANQIGDIFNTASSKERTALANALGITTSAFHDSVINHRMNMHYNDTPGLARLSTHYYRRIGLTHLTNSQRRSTMAAGHNAMTAWADDLLNGSAKAKTEAAAQFRDLGVADKYQEDLAQWLVDKKGDLPTQKDLETPTGNLWGQAIRNLTDQVIQDPYKVDKPLLASSNGFGRAMFGLMSFNYAFYHNIVEGTVGRHVSRIKEAEGVLETTGAIGAAVGSMATASAGIYSASLVTTIAREAVFNQAGWQEHKKKGDLMSWLSDLAIQRTGINGPLDPVIQAFTSFRYEKSLSSLTAGAQVGFFLDAIANIARPFVSEAAGTNTLHYNSAKAFYQSVIVPIELAALTSMPGGPLTGPLYGTAMMFLAGRGAGERFAEAVVGPKGSTDPTMKKPEAEETVDEEMTPEPETPDEPAGDGKKEAGGSGAKGALIGVLDDLVAPAARVAPAVWNAMPGSAKLVAALVAGTISLAEVRKIYGRFTEPP